MLTKKQKNLLLFINKKLRSSGVSPSYEEMKESLNLKSKSGIHRLISALEERGFIKRLAHKARALEVIKLPETASANDIYNNFSIICCISSFYNYCITLVDTCFNHRITLNFETKIITVFF